MKIVLLICLLFPVIAFSQSKVRSGQKVAESIMFNLEHGKYPPDVYFDSKVQFEYKNKIFVVKFVLKSEEGVDFNYITRTLVHQETRKMLLVK